MHKFMGIPPQNQSNSRAVENKRTSQLFVHWLTIALVFRRIKTIRDLEEYTGQLTLHSFILLLKESIEYKPLSQ